MHHVVKSSLVGASSGVITYFASMRALGYTMAIAMPQNFSTTLWDALVLFGLGAALVALVIHLLAIRFMAAQPAPALLGFLGATTVALAVTGQLQLGYKAFAAWLIGVLLAMAVQRWLWPNNSFKPKPLRGSA